MTPINKLGILVALITVVVLLMLFGAWWGVKKYWFDPLSQRAAATPQSTGDLEADRDGDGLSDLVENLYKTDPDKADTDNDTVSDGEEIRLGRNPLLAEGVTAGVGDILLGSQVKDISTFTGKYLASLPEDTPREEVLSKEKLEAFVNVNKGELLPTLPAGLIKTSKETGQAETRAYLDQVSPAQNAKLHIVSNEEIEKAWRAAYVNNQPEAINEVITKLLANARTLEAVAAPKNLVELHTKLIAASHALVNNAERLRDMNRDFVGGLIGAKNIEDLAPVFQEIEAEIDRLDKAIGA